MLQLPDPTDPNAASQAPANAEVRPQTNSEGGLQAPFPGDLALPPVSDLAAPDPATPYRLRLETVFDFLAGGQILEIDGTKAVAARHLSRPGRCQLRIFEPGLTEPDRANHLPQTPPAPAPVIVIATDLEAENPGPSVTNAAEDIATQACLRYGLDPAQLLFVEHYDDRFRGISNGRLIGVGDGELIGRAQGESYDWVTFQRQGDQLSSPQWRHTTKAKVEARLGQKLL